MIFSPTPLAGSYTIELEPFTDERGWFARFYCKKEFQQDVSAKRKTAERLPGKKQG